MLTISEALAASVRSSGAAGTGALKLQLAQGDNYYDPGTWRDLLVPKLTQSRYCAMPGAAMRKGSPAAGRGISDKLQNASLSPNWIILGSRALVIRPRLELPNCFPGGFQFG